MNKSPAVKHLFKDCEPFFENLLCDYNNKFCESLLVKGTATSSDHLDVLKYDSTNPIKFILNKIIVKKINNSSPIIQVQSFSEKKISHILYIYDFSEPLYNYGSSFYMLQKNFIWAGNHKTRFSIWKMVYSDFLSLNQYWL